jgi:hypothetical protein
MVTTHGSLTCGWPLIELHSVNGIALSLGVTRFSVRRPSRGVRIPAEAYLSSACHWWSRTRRPARPRPTPSFVPLLGGCGPDRRASGLSPDDLWPARKLAGALAVSIFWTRSGVRGGKRLVYVDAPQTLHLVPTGAWTGGPSNAALQSSSRVGGPPPRHLGAALGPMSGASSTGRTWCGRPSRLLVVRVASTRDRARTTKQSSPTTAVGCLSAKQRLRRAIEPRRTRRRTCRRASKQLPRPLPAEPPGDAQARGGAVALRGSVGAAPHRCVHLGRGPAEAVARVASPATR